MRRQYLRSGLALLVVLTTGLAPAQVLAQYSTTWTCDATFATYGQPDSPSNSKYGCAIVYWGPVYDYNYSPPVLTAATINLRAYQGSCGYGGCAYWQRYYAMDWHLYGGGWAPYPGAYWGAGTVHSNQVPWESDSGGIAGGTDPEPVQVEMRLIYWSGAVGNSYAWCSQQYFHDLYYNYGYKVGTQVC